MPDWPDSAAETEKVKKIANKTMVMIADKDSSLFIVLSPDSILAYRQSGCKAPPTCLLTA